jgi:hypothetical protein
MGRLLQIGFIWFGCAVAWMILGSTLVVRSGETSGALLEEVHALWGPPLELRPPIGTYTVVQQRKDKTVVRDPATGRETETEVTREEQVAREIRLEGSTLRVKLASAQRKKGLLWFPTYEVELAGRYRLRNDSGEARRIEFAFPLPGDHAVYDGLSVLDEEGRALEVAIRGGAACWSALVGDEETRTFAVTVRSRGTQRFAYAMGGAAGEVRDLDLVVDTDFPAVDFPAGSISPTRHEPRGTGWHGEWKFSRLIAASGVALELPRRIHPGPLAARITFFAPVGLLFFFFVVAVRSAAQGRPIHPLSYFFFGCAFFAFHLLFAYLVDHLAIAPALAIASLASVFLVVSYARLFMGWLPALRELGIAQCLYLVLFSATFLLEGYTGLAITVGAVVTLFVMMQLTGRRDAAAMLGDRVKEDRSTP